MGSGVKLSLGILAEFQRVIVDLGSHVEHLRVRVDRMPFVGTASEHNVVLALLKVPGRQGDVQTLHRENDVPSRFGIPHFIRQLRLKVEPPFLTIHLDEIIGDAGTGEHDVYGEVIDAAGLAIKAKKDGEGMGALVSTALAHPRLKGTPILFGVALAHDESRIPRFREIPVLIELQGGMIRLANLPDSVFRSPSPLGREGLRRKYRPKDKSPGDATPAPPVRLESIKQPHSFHGFSALRSGRCGFLGRWIP